ncbi:MAG: sensor histidine kinase, partial [Wujia sp.]
DAVCESFADAINQDTNNEVFVNSSNRHIRHLAATLNKTKKELRRAYLRYVDGDIEVKNTITNVAHDIRTPLTAICGYVDILKEQENNLSKEGRKQLAVIEDRLEVMRRLTAELFQYSISISYDFKKDIEDVCLNSEIEEAIASFYTEFKKANIEPEIQLCHEQVNRRMSRQALARIFNNVLSNVIKYSDGDCRISLNCDGKISIQNHSKAIDNIVVNHLFDRFYTVKSGENSTGIGLSIAKLLTDDMGGNISAEAVEDCLVITITFP